MNAHADKRPPSSAGRWLSCPGSVDIVRTYPNEPSEASLKGDEAHTMLNTAMTFGIMPENKDIDLTYSVMYAYEQIMDTVRSYDKSCELFTEVQLDIPETGEFGTADICIVTDSLIHVMDYKNGYVPVDIHMNPQMMCYLLGAIARWGTRKSYKISVIQPNYTHADGMFRHYDVTQEDLAWFRKEVQWSMINNHLAAGKHCKTSYCPHRGSCATFIAWSQENLKLAWFPGELAAMDDQTLAAALEQADILKGWENALRGEALRRMIHQDRAIPGYKVVRGRKDRAFLDDNARETVFNRMRDKLSVPEEALKNFAPISVADVERIVKGWAKPQGRKAWISVMADICGPDMLVPPNQSLTVEKAIDGRKPFVKGSEFEALKTLPKAPELTSNIVYSNGTSEKAELSTTSELAHKPDDGLVDIL